MQDVSSFAILGVGVGVILLVMAIVLFLTIFPFWCICSKAGYSGALSLLLLVPVVGWLFPFYLALTEWPIERRIRDLQLRSYDPNQSQNPAVRSYWPT